jgi:hypothetical protein
MISVNDTGPVVTILAALIGKRAIQEANTHHV